MTTVVVDGNNLGIASHFGNVTLSDPDGRASGAIYGFIRSLKPILDRTQIATGEKVRVIVAWDAARSWREVEFPEYKSSRKKDRDPEMEEQLKRYADQLPRLRSLLSTLGVGQIRAHGFEADDIAGWLTQRPGNWMLVSNDKDWLQLVRPNVGVWQTLRDRYVTPETWEEVTKGMVDASDGIFPANVEEFVHMLAIAGDSGDDVPGQKGIGYGTALKFLHGKLPTGTPAKPGKKYEAAKAWMDDPNGFARSLRLVELRNVSIPATSVVLEPGAYNISSFMDQCVMLGFNSILSEIGTWTQPFARTV